MSEKSKADYDKAWKAFEASFRQRRWDAIRSSWPSFIGGPIDPPGCCPSESLTDILEGGGIIVDPIPKHSITTITHPRSELPSIVFREAVFWLHKSLYVLGASETHVEKGLPTWSLSAAYQSGYFAARSILAFLGVSIGEYKRISVIVDLCRDMHGLRPERMAELGPFAPDVSLHSVGVLFDHRQVWQLFQRILRVSSCSLWAEGWATYLAQVDIGDITKQRHGLHYQLQYWVFPDLQHFEWPEKFSDVEPTGTGRALFDNESGNFSLRIGLLIARMALQLFMDLCDCTNRLKDERTLTINTFSEERHPIFAEILRQPLRR